VDVLKAFHNLPRLFSFARADTWTHWASKTSIGLSVPRDSTFSELHILNNQEEFPSLNHCSHSKFGILRSFALHPDIQFPKQIHL